MIKKIQKSQQRPGTASAGGVNLPFKITTTTLAGKSGVYASVSKGFLQNSLNSQDYTAIYGLGTPFQIGPESLIYLEVVYDLDYGYPRMANICETNLNGQNIYYRPSYESQYFNRFGNTALSQYSGWSTYYFGSDYYVDDNFNYNVATRTQLIQNDPLAYSFAYTSLMNYVATGTSDTMPIVHGTRRAALDGFCVGGDTSSSDGYYSTNNLLTGLSYNPPSNFYSDQIKESLSGFTGEENRVNYSQFKSYTLIGYTSLIPTSSYDTPLSFYNHQSQTLTGSYLVQSLFSNLMIQGFVDQMDLPLRIPCPYSGPLYGY